MKYVITVFSAVLIFGGLYFKFLYDVPDGAETTNTWVSWILVIFGVIGIMISLMWKTRNPLELYDKDDRNSGRIKKKNPDGKPDISRTRSNQRGSKIE
jgi:hypothetical protein